MNIMSFILSLKQILRTPIKLICYFLVIALVAALLCIGLNLYKNSEKNITAADEAFTTVVVPKFYANIDENGKRSVKSSLDYLGYEECAANEYDLQPIMDNEAVKKIDVRGVYGAYVNDENGARNQGNYSADDVIIFTVNGDESIKINAFSQQVVPITVEYSALGYANESYRSDMTICNSISTMLFVSYKEVDGTIVETHEDMPEFEVGDADGSITLEPGKRYIAITLNSAMYNPINDTVEVLSIMINTQDQYHVNSKINYNKIYGWGENSSPITTQPKHMPIAEYTDDFFDTERGRFYKEVAEAYYINKNSMVAITTGDASLMRAFHSGGVHVGEGRMISEEEYATGAKVCMVSKLYAEYNGWSVGDKIPLSFYKINNYPDKVNRSPVMTYGYDFFDEGEYEIVGIYEGNVKNEQNGSTYVYGEPLNEENVIVPTASVSNAPEISLSSVNTSILLKNDLAEEFMADMQSSGLTDESEDWYQLELTVYDQDYSYFAGGIKQLQRISKLTLMLSAAVAAVSAVLLALVHAMQKRRETAAMRSLGAKMGQAVTVATAGIIVVCLIASAVGAYVGSTLSSDITEYAIHSADTEDEDEGGTELSKKLRDEQFIYVTEQDTSLAVISAASISAVFMLTVLILVLNTYRKPPILLLGAKE